MWSTWGQSSPPPPPPPPLFFNRSIKYNIVFKNSILSSCFKFCRLFNLFLFLYLLKFSDRGLYLVLQRALLLLDTVHQHIPVLLLLLIVPMLGQLKPPSYLITIAQGTLPTKQQNFGRELAISSIRLDNCCSGVRTPQTQK